MEPAFRRIDHGVARAVAVVIREATVPGDSRCMACVRGTGWMARDNPRRAIQPVPRTRALQLGAAGTGASLLAAVPAAPTARAVGDGGRPAGSRTAAAARADE